MDELIREHDKDMSLNNAVEVHSGRENASDSSNFHNINDGNELIVSTTTAEPTFQFTQRLSLEDIRRLQSKFVKERNWDQYHQPRNLVLAMMGEVGEVAELFQWKGEVKEGCPDWTPKEKNHLAQELSDVLIYLIRLAEKCHVDLPTAVLEKIALNKEKYPADKTWGSSKKYNEYL